ncbi:hypothetical protein MMB75_07365 [Paenibacillus sp. P2(2022)]|nr:hypothetical protein [Paenibacillus polymyxa]KAF6585170.1 hypothetical protein G9G57_07700 [Paenibacillus sp. EKM211P]KAF6614381.1 hypothetical protein HFE00_25260 [Paenibacillus sp. EKM101P]KAF6624944.1 hypothetical protein HFE03_03220 [Paenibacillus sp. EKM102P]KAF6636255.1 hypothetical protein HFE01_01810 [Paenibacillus sp. EKM10P]KAF6649017.1 hypothetical protein HFE02_09740 [Paenibacillus sp. EKM11P]KAF6658114.1 hypothetical protein HFD99_06910 [Paenibacillus sp. EKM301P]MDG0053488.1
MWLESYGHMKLKDIAAS